MYDLESKKESGKITAKPQTIFIHPDWNSKTKNFDGDIAVLELDENIEFTQSIQPICLWNSLNAPRQGRGIVIGYGKSEDKTKKHETFPKKLEVPIVKSNEECFLSDPEIAIISSKRTFCAGLTDGRAPCLG